MTYTWALPVPSLTEIAQLCKTTGNFVKESVNNPVSIIMYYYILSLYI